jgi:hypothetical protein
MHGSDSGGARWRFRLEGSAENLRELRVFCSSGPLRIVIDEEAHWLEWDELEPDQDAAAIASAANGALGTLLGAARLLEVVHDPVRLGTQQLVSASGSKATFVVLQSVVAVRHVNRPTILINGVAPPSWEDRLLATALRDDDVEQALRLYGSREPDMRDLYFILELVEKSIAPGTVQERGWISNAERTRFRRTVNSRRALGDLARHGSDFAPPEKPTTLGEARLAIRDVVLAWLKEKTGNVAQEIMNSSGPDVA